MRRRPPRSTQSRSSAASDVYKRQDTHGRLWDIETSATASSFMDHSPAGYMAVSYTHLRAHETRHDIVCRLLLEKKKKKKTKQHYRIAGKHRNKQTMKDNKIN